MSHTITPEIIREVRHAHGLSRALLGKRLGCSPRTVEHWEQGRAPHRMFVPKLLALKRAVKKDEITR